MHSWLWAPPSHKPAKLCLVWLLPLPGTGCFQKPFYCQQYKGKYCSNLIRALNRRGNLCTFYNTTEYCFTIWHFKDYNDPEWCSRFTSRRAVDRVTIGLKSQLIHNTKITAVCTKMHKKTHKYTLWAERRTLFVRRNGTVGKVCPRLRTVNRAIFGINKTCQGMLYGQNVKECLGLAA
jgi:hypothetical protein